MSRPLLDFAGAAALSGGRLEHVESGRSGRFASGEERIAFFAGVLREIERPTTGGDTYYQAFNSGSSAVYKVVPRP